MMLSKDNQRQSRSELQTLITQMNKSKKSGIKRTPRFRFRAAGRAVINNLKWLTEDTTSNLMEDINTKGMNLTNEIRGILKTKVRSRTLEDKNFIFRVIGNLGCLQRYPEKIREQLMSSCIFAYYPPGRVIVKEGYQPLNMYFIIAGQVKVSKLIYDAGEDKMKDSEIGTMSAGEFFGELNILHSEPWPTTITTITHTELLRVRETHFQNILHQFLGEQKEKITKCLNMFPFFKDWTSRTVIECCIMSRIQNYPKNELILGDKYGNYSSAYFIVSGECTVIYHLTAEIDKKTKAETLHRVTVVHKEETFPTSRLLRGIERERMRKIRDPFLVNLIINQFLKKMVEDLPLPESRTDLSEGMHDIALQSHFLKIATLMPGQCFGIGENLDNKFILSNSEPVSLLEIPRHFLKLHNRGNVWGRAREFFNITYPTPQEIFNKCITERKWVLWRKKYMESLLKVNRPFTGLTVAEQPYSCRLYEDILNPIFVRIKHDKVKDEAK